MTRLFGTDGIRGVANAELTCEIAYRLGQAVVKFKGPRILVARDTRISGEMLESAILAGIMSAGGDAYCAGIIPTPAVAYLNRAHNMDAGIMISASHNPPEYNGLKVFDGSGYKLPDDVEDEIDAFINSGGLEATSGCVAGDACGKRFELAGAHQEYIDFVVSSVKNQGIDFRGLNIALDCANGASSETSERALTLLGANVDAFNCEEDGADINVNCGSTCLDELKSKMSTGAYDIGIAHDGDADRVMLMSKCGVEIDGDIVCYLLGKDLRSRGLLKNDTVVSTVMCNLGLKIILEKEGINLVQTKVGDRYVLEEMLASDFSIGGEQSGHIILLDYNSTGDGLMTAVQFIAAIKRSGMTVDEAISDFVKFPQVLINVRVEDKKSALENAELKNCVAEIERELGSSGRVLLRESGTEPVIRVMVEAKTEELAKSCAEKIAAFVK